MSEDEDRAGFLARWSQRKREAVRHTPEPEAPAQATPPSNEGDIVPVDPATLPSVEDLTHESDLSVFFQKGVPDRLRNAALRRMWEIDPAVRDYVGDALDYAWDWNVPGGVPGNGELTASEVKDIAARFFSDDSTRPDELAAVQSDTHSENVIEHVAAQQPVQNAPVAVEESRPTQDCAGLDEPAALKNQDFPVPRAEAQAPGAAAAPQRKPRRHGGALPVASPKV